MKNVGEKEAWAYPGTTQIIWVSPIISATGKATYFKFGQYIQRVHPNKMPLKILEKRESGRIKGLPNFFGYPLLSQERLKLRYLNFACTFYRFNRSKSPLKISGKVGVSIVRDSQKCSEHPYIWRIARSSLRQLSFLVFIFRCTNKTGHISTQEDHPIHLSVTLFPVNYNKTHKYAVA